MKQKAIDSTLAVIKAKNTAQDYIKNAEKNLQSEKKSKVSTLPSNRVIKANASIKA